MRRRTYSHARDDDVRARSMATTTTATTTSMKITPTYVSPFAANDAATTPVPVTKPAAAKPAAKPTTTEAKAKAKPTEAKPKPTCAKPSNANANANANANGTRAPSNAGMGKKKRKRKDKDGQAAGAEAKKKLFTKKDWTCACGFLNYSKNKLACHKCKAARPARVGRNAAEDYLSRWAVMETTEVNAIHHQFLLKQVGIDNELRDEFFDFFVEYCGSLPDSRRRKIVSGAKKVRARLDAILQACDNRKGAASESDEGEDEDKAPVTANVAQTKKRGNRGKKGRGKQAAKASPTPAM